MNLLRLSMTTKTLKELLTHKIVMFEDEVKEAKEEKDYSNYEYYKGRLDSYKEIIKFLDVTKILEQRNDTR